MRLSVQELLLLQKKSAYRRDNSPDNQQHVPADTSRGRHARMVPRLCLSSTRKDGNMFEDRLTDSSSGESSANISDVAPETSKFIDAIVESHEEIWRKLDREPFTPLCSPLFDDGDGPEPFPGLTSGGSVKFPELGEISAAVSLDSWSVDAGPRTPEDSYDKTLDLQTDTHYHPVPSPMHMTLVDDSGYCTSAPPVGDTHSSVPCVDVEGPKSSTPRPDQEDLGSARLECHESLSSSPELDSAPPEQTTKSRGKKSALPTRDGNRFTPRQRAVLMSAFSECIYVGLFRHHMLALELDVSASSIKDFFKRQRILMFRELKYLGKGSMIDNVRRHHLELLQKADRSRDLSDISKTNEKRREARKRKNAQKLHQMNPVVGSKTPGSSTSGSDSTEQPQGKVTPHPNSIQVEPPAKKPKPGLSSCPKQRLISTEILARSEHGSPSNPPPCWQEPGVMNKFAMSSQWVNSQLYLRPPQQEPFHLGPHYRPLPPVSSILPTYYPQTPSVPQTPVPPLVPPPSTPNPNSKMPCFVCNEPKCFITNTSQSRTNSFTMCPGDTPTNHLSASSSHHQHIWETAGTPQVQHSSSIAPSHNNQFNCLGSFRGQYSTHSFNQFNRPAVSFGNTNYNLNSYYLSSSTSSHQWGPRFLRADRHRSQNVPYSGFVKQESQGSARSSCRFHEDKSGLPQLHSVVPLFNGAL